MRQPWPGDPERRAWFGGAPVYEHCPGSNRLTQESDRWHRVHGDTTGDIAWKNLTCAACHTSFPLDVCRAADANRFGRRPPDHDRLLTVAEQADRQLQEVAGALGFDPWNDRPVLHAIMEAAGAREISGTPTVAARVAAGTAALAVIKAQQAPPDIVTAIRTLDKWAPEIVPQHVRADNTHLNDVTPIPLLTEAFLYPLLGKEDARTLLALWRAITEAAGA